MKKIRELNFRAKLNVDEGWFHDSRGDVNKLGKAINAILDKQDEMIKAINELIDERNSR